MKNLLIVLTSILLTGPLVRASVPDQDEGKCLVAPKVLLKARAFPLKDVRLLDGPFKKAMDLDAKYLLDLEPDRLLSRFREYAGLEPKGKIYGGWESRGVSGHILGHYLSACAMMYAASGDGRFLDRVNYIVDELALCQQAHGNGYVGGIPDAKRIFAEVAAGDIKATGFGLNGGWVPWYTLHKLHAGLLDAYRHCHNEKAKTIVTKLAEWAEGVTGKLSDEQFQHMLRCEHGGMNEALADVYAITGEREFLDLAGRFNHHAVIDPLSRREDRLEGLHANTQVPKIIGAARQYELTGNKDLRTAAAFFWEVVTQDRSFVNGGNSEAEHFHRKGELWKHLTARTAETCNTYNMLKLTRHLFTWTAERRYADYYERALYNHILASQDPKTGMTIYFCSLKPGHFLTYGKPYDSFWCCTGSGLENHVKYGEGIYFHDEASLYVNLFIASELTWKAKGLKVRQETRFPEEPKTRLVLDCEKPVHMALKIRHAYWADSPLEAAVNGQAVVADSQDGYLTIERSWTDGDVVEITLPMNLRIEPMANQPRKVAIMYGPIVLAGQLGREGFTGEMPYSSNQRAYENVPTPDVPVLVADGKPVDEWVKRVSGKALQFKTVGVGRPRDVSLIPFYRAHHQRYTVYWDLLTEKDWRQRQAEQEARQRRLKELRARTVDVLVPQTQPERDHNYQGEKSSAGMFNGRHWRHAYPGGWFSYDMKIATDRPVDLMVTYWGSDVGNRKFDVMVDGHKIGTQTLNMNHPGEFFDVTYPIPDDVTRNKDKVTVRFQSHPGAMAGGVFGCRIVKREGEPSGPEALLKTLDPFYKQHVVADGLLIVGSEKVSPVALREVAYLAKKLLANRPDVMQKLGGKRKMYACVMAYNEMQTDLPECRRMEAWWDYRARGLAGGSVSCGEENVLGFPGDPWKGENIFIHEFAHGLQGVIGGIDERFNERLAALYQEAKQSGRFRGYAIEGGIGEFWAEGVQAWFNCNGTIRPKSGGGQSSFEILGPRGEHVCHIATREQLKTYLPEYAKLLDESFGGNEWTYVPVADRLDEPHLRGYDPAKAPTFRWPAEVIEAFNRFRAEQAKKQKQLD